MAETNGPYFKGQEPSCKRCGAYYPDVLRTHDTREGIRCYRHLNCINCGSIFEPLCSSAYSPKVGAAGDLDEIRKREKERLRNKNESADTSAVER